MHQRIYILSANFTNSITKIENENDSGAESPHIHL